MWWTNLWIRKRNTWTTFYSVSKVCLCKFLPSLTIRICIKFNALYWISTYERCIVWKNKKILTSIETYEARMCICYLSMLFCNFDQIPNLIVFNKLNHMYCSLPFQKFRNVNLCHISWYWLGNLYQLILMKRKACRLNTALIHKYYLAIYQRFRNNCFPFTATCYSFIFCL